MAPQLAEVRARRGCRHCWTRPACPTCCGSSAVPRSSTVDAPDAALANDAVVAATRPSVVKIRGVAPGLPKGVGGHRFRRRAEPGDVQRARGRGLRQRHRRGRRPDLRRQRGVSYDPEADISILDVPNLPSAPLSFAESAAHDRHRRDRDGLPGRRRLRRHARPCARDHRAQRPRHLPHRRPSTREVYTIRGTVRQGNSGGPMIDRSGQGARRGVRRRGRRRRHRLRADREGGLAPAREDRQHPARRDAAPASAASRTPASRNRDSCSLTTSGASSWPKCPAPAMDT